MLIYWNQSPPEKFGLQMFRLSRFREQGLQPLMADLPEIRFQETQSPASQLHQCRREIPWTVCGRSSRSRNEDLHLLIHLFGYKSNSHGSCRRPRHRQCLTAIPCFIARRGQPRLFFSDNGSNFLGARKQIRQRPLMLDHDYIKDQLLNQSVEWKLNLLLLLISVGCGRDSFSVSKELFS